MTGRPSARTPWRVRAPRAIKEFVALPILVVGVLLTLAVLSILGDQAHGPFFTGVRHTLGHYIGAQSAAGTLGAVATGLVTVTSITFSVLLLAVQQTASSLSPVVFDQFVRRRSNQIYLGLFVGLALYSYIVMAAVQPKTPPIIGAFIATSLTVAALGCLLFLVYSTIDQMRPDNVMRQLHDRAALAHDRETALLRRTRRSSCSAAPVRATYRSSTYGYIESIDLERLGAAMAGQGPEAEIELCVSIGEPVATGDVIARVRHTDTDSAAGVCEHLAAAVPASPTPDLDYDPRTALRNIANIGWTSGSTSKHNPAIAAQALHAMRDLAARWLAEGERSGPDPLPVVYPDGDVEAILDSMYSAVVVAAESRQHQQAVRVLAAYRFLWPRGDERARRRIRRDVAAMQPILAEMPPSPALEQERAELRALVTPVTVGVGDRRDGSRPATQPEATDGDLA